MNKIVSSTKATLHRLLFVFVALLAVSIQAPSYARADDDSAFDRLMTEGLDAYKARKYEQAAARFQAAFELRAEPELVYNIARSYEKALRVKEAIEAYERFLRLPGTTAELRTNALAQLEALKKEQDALSRADAPSSKRRRADRDMSDEAASARGTGVERGAEDPTRRGFDAPSPVAVEAPMSSRARAIEWTLIGVGGAGIVAGVAFGVFAQGKSNEFGRSNDPAEKQTLRNDAKLNALIADIAIGTGALTAAIGAGLLLFLDGDTSVGLTPSVGPQGGGVSVAGRF